MTLAERLKKARLSLGYTQSQMATALHTNARTWQVYESGGSTPGGKVLADLARLGINLNWLMTGEGKMRERRWPIRISKEQPDGLGRHYELTYDIDEGFSARLYKQLGEGKNIQWLAKESGVEEERISDLMYADAVPTVDEIISIADALKLNPRWIAEESPFPEEDKGLKELARGIKSVRHIEDDKARLARASKVIDAHLSQYDFHLDSNKGLTLLMTAFTLLDDTFCDRKEELFDPLVDNLVKLCLPGKERPDAVDVDRHMSLAQDAIKRGDTDKARIEYLRAAKDWKEVVDGGDNKFPNELEQARREFTEFVQTDPVYTEGVRTLLAVIRATPGILQRELYNSCPGIERKLVIYILNFAIMWGLIDRKGEQLTVREG